MKPSRPLSRGTYRMILGLSWLISLVGIALAVVMFPALRKGIELEGTNAILIPLSPFYLAAAVMFAIWAFLRLAVPVQPRTTQERSRPILQRLSYLQLFAGAGIVIAVVSTALTLLLPSPVPSSTTLIGWNTVLIFTFQLAAAALAATLLYTGARIGRIASNLAGMLLFVGVAMADLPVTLALLERIKAAPDREYRYGGNEYPEADAESMDTETDCDEDLAWMHAAGIGFVHYCLEYGKNTSTDSTLCFADRLLIDYQNTRLEEAEDYPGKNSPRWNTTTYFNGQDCYHLYLLSNLIFDRTELGEDEMYETVSERILPVILNGLRDHNLYRSSQLESLVNMLDYAYHDLQSPGNEKLESLYSDMAAEQFLPAMAVLLPYFNNPYAMVHSGFDHVHMLWAYSFWARRWKDGHLQVCRKLLDRVLETWPNKTYTSDRMGKTERYYRQKRLTCHCTAEEVLREVEEAFADVPRPLQYTILFDEMESAKRAKTGKTFSRYTWQGIPAKVLHENADALMDFTPEGFRYYLPAFLTETVRNYQPGKRLHTMLLYALDYNNPVPAYRRENFEILTLRQEMAVCHFLAWLGANHHTDFTGANGEESPLWQAVESWWVQFEEADCTRPDAAMQTASLPTDSKWPGEYELSFPLGRMNDSTEIFANYALSIGRDSVSFAAAGYKMYYEYRCTMNERDGRLVILCDRLADGSGNLTAGDTLGVVTFDAGSYYLQSPIVYENPNAPGVYRHLLTKITP